MKRFADGEAMSATTPSNEMPAERTLGSRKRLRATGGSCAHVEVCIAFRLAQRTAHVADSEVSPRDCRLMLLAIRRDFFRKFLRVSQQGRQDSNLQPRF